MTALILTHDDVLLGRMVLPTRLDSVQVEHQPRPSGAGSVLAVRATRFAIDRADSLAHQLLANDPDVWVYRPIS